MKNIILLTVVALGGCASHTGIVPTGGGSYMIAKQQATGFPGLGNMKAEIIGESSRFCAESGKELQIISAHDSPPPYIFGNYPRSEVSFTCVKR